MPDTSRKVPVEPSEEMIEAFDAVAMTTMSGAILHVREALAAAIAAAPQPVTGIETAKDTELLSRCYIAMRDAMGVIDVNEGPGLKHSKILNALAQARVDIERLSSTPAQAPEAAPQAEPVAWRWRYALADGTKKRWRLRDTPLEPQEPGLHGPTTAGLDVEPLVPATALAALQADRDEARELAQLFSQASRKGELVLRADARVAELEDKLVEATALAGRLSGENDTLKEGYASATKEAARLRGEAERAAEDERDRLYAEADKGMRAAERDRDEQDWTLHTGGFVWLKSFGAILPADRAALRAKTEAGR